MLHLDLADRAELIRRLNLKTLKIVNDKPDCHLWMGTKNNYGYGVIRFKKVLYRVHVLAYELFNSAILNALSRVYVQHECGIRHCINPEHLSLSKSSKGYNPV